MLINGHTVIIAHIGYPTHSFKAPLIYNPYFANQGINALVVPMSCQSDNYEPLVRSLFRLGNVAGALITMPHKVRTVDGEGFVRGVMRKGFELQGARALVVGAGGVGCAIAASLAAAGVSCLGLFDVRDESARALAGRLKAHYPTLEVRSGSCDPAGFDLVVNATPLGMNEGDSLPLDVSRLEPGTFVGEVVMRTEMTAFLIAAAERGCRVQIGSDMLFEQIPAYLEFFGLPSTNAEVLRSVARL
jgi:shikimate dehydrogenase